MTRSEIFRNNYKYQSEESKKEESKKDNKFKMGKVLFASSNELTIKDLLIKSIDSNEEER